jgi:hypothetical protein
MGMATRSRDVECHNPSVVAPCCVRALDCMELEAQAAPALRSASDDDAVSPGA